MAKANKRALLLSALAIVLCIAMLVGTTYAWFTDTATTGVNKIQSGKLRISLIDDDGNSLEGKTIRWTRKAASGKGSEIINENGLPLWEPGATYCTEWFNIRNDGNLALKYKVTVNGFTGDTKLLDVLEFSFVLSSVNVPGGMIVIKSLDEFNNYTGYLLPASEGIVTDNDETHPENVSIRITAKMKADAGNEYQDLSLEGIGVTVVATQYTYEKDSFNDQYDKNATYPEYTVIDAEDLAKAAKEGGVITVDNDIDSESAIVANGTVILDMNGKKVLGSHVMRVSTFALPKKSVRALSVRCPFPVAARLPYRVIFTMCVPLTWLRNISAAKAGPIVWLDDGPCPILYISLMVRIAG